MDSSVAFFDLDHHDNVMPSGNSSGKRDICLRGGAGTKIDLASSYELLLRVARIGFGAILSLFRDDYHPERWVEKLTVLLNS